MDDIAVLLVVGASLGAVYALVAVSVTLVFNATGVVNFAGGHFAVVAGMVSGNLAASVWGNALVSILVGGLLGGACYVLAIRPVARRGVDEMSLAIAALAFGLVLDGVLGLLWQGSVANADPLVGGHFAVGATQVETYRVFVVLVGLVILLLVGTFMARSLQGSSMRATSFNESLARVYGVRVERTKLLAWVIAGSLCGTAGVLLTPLVSMNRGLALVLIIKGFAAAILGGIGSPTGAVTGAMAIAMAEVFFQRYVSSGYGVVVTFGVLFIAMALRPQGLFGARRAVERV